MSPWSGGDWRECRLVRDDGTVWLVTGLEAVACPPRVDAVRPPAPGDGGEATPGAPWSPETVAELRGEPLVPGDRVDWLGPDGEVVWTFGRPAEA